jgi:hypothetical protein
MSSRTITLVPADAAHPSDPPNDDRQYRVAIEDRNERRGARVDNRVYAVRTDGAGAVRITPEEGGSSVTAWAVAIGDVRWVFVNGRVFELSEARPLARARAGHGAGTVTAIHCREGELVQPGLTLIEIGE